MARRMKLYLIQVTGSDIFPVDMLRYDHCWPRNSNDAAEMAASLMHFDEPRKRTVTLASQQPATEARWRSFGWTVDHCRKVG